MSDSVKKILVRAKEYDSSGRRLEALKLYEDGISELLQLSKNNSDQQVRESLRKKISKYLNRAEEIEKEIQKHSTLGEIIDTMVIAEGVTGYDYQRIFGKYLTQEVHEIEIEEPYLRENYQIFNLVRFLELAIIKCRNLNFVRLSTVQDTRSNCEQTKGIASLQKDLIKRSIQLTIKFREKLHDRQVILSNGYRIKIGRGLHLFKPTAGKYVIGFTDYSFRQCLETNIDVFKYQKNL